ncbi:MAG: Gfo/Idh/MocA family oxidoreductase [Pseudomonadota bacterium]
MSYQTLLSLPNRDFSDKKVLIIGAGWMARQYGQALKSLGVSDMSFLARSESSAAACAGEFNGRGRWGGYKECLPACKPCDLTIIATPIHELKSAALEAMACGQKNILVEKPGSLYSSEFPAWEKEAELSGARVRLAFNRLCYPNLWKLRELIDQDGGISSCRYTFTELISSINFNKENEDVYQRWGIANSLHVIGLAHALIGLPVEMCSYRRGGLDWHPVASKFVGAGVTDQGVHFSYLADWDSAGRWGVEIMTPEYAYRLMPLEKLFRCRRGSFDWEPVEFQVPFPGVKQGVAEETAVMLDPVLEERIPLVRLTYARDLVAMAEKIFGYD